MFDRQSLSGIMRHPAPAFLPSGNKLRTPIDAAFARTFNAAYSAGGDSSSQQATLCLALSHKPACRASKDQRLGRKFSRIGPLPREWSAPKHRKRCAD